MNYAFTIQLVAQQLKDEVRERMLLSAEVVFAQKGYSGATVAQIAERAGVSAGNIYRYFKNKDELYYAIFTDELARSFLQLVRKRVASLLEADDLTDLAASANDDADTLLQFWIEHRLKVIVLLDRAQGSRFEPFAGTFVDELMKPTMLKFREASGGRRLRPVVRFTLRNVFTNTVRTIVSILEEHEGEAAIREAFAGFWSYQLAGLAGFERWVLSWSKNS